MNSHLTVKVGPSATPEIQYILDVILGDMLGLSYKIDIVDSDSIDILWDGKLLSTKNLFLNSLGSDSTFLSRRHVPEKRIEQLDIKPYSTLMDIVGHGEIPILFGNARVSASNDRVSFDFDIFGACFFMLSLFDEVTLLERDARGRVPFHQTFISRNGLSRRPLVNEYLELLWHFFSVLWPQLDRKKRTYRVVVTQDIDRAFYFPVKGLRMLIKACLGDILKRKSPGLLIKRFLCCIFPSGHRDQFDPHNTFGFFLSVLERHNLTARFYVIPGSCKESREIHQDVRERRVTSLLRKLIQSGHQVGVHPYYGSYLNSEVLDKNISYLREHLGEEDLEFSSISRQHGLQWDPAQTMVLLDRCGISLDSSVGFAENPGFRSGCCYSYRAYDLINRRPLNIIEEPLIVMDTTYASYLRCSRREYIASVIELASICRRFEGDFVGLWHNCKLASKRAKSDFKTIVDNIV